MNKYDVTLTDICQYLNNNNKAINAKNISIVTEAVLNDKLIPLTLDEMYSMISINSVAQYLDESGYAVNSDNINILIEELLDEGKKWEKFKHGARVAATSAFLIPAAFGAAGKSMPQLKTNTSNNVVNTISSSVNKAGNFANNTGKIIRNQTVGAANLIKDGVSAYSANKAVNNAQKALDSAAPVKPTEPTKPSKLSYLTVAGDPESYDADAYNTALTKYTADKQAYDNNYKQYLVDYDNYEKNVKNNPNSDLNKKLTSAKDKQTETNKTVTQNLGDNIYNVTGGNTARSTMTSKSSDNYTSSSVYTNLPKAAATSALSDVVALGATKELVAALRNRKRKIGGATRRVIQKSLSGTTAGNIIGKLPVTKMINKHNDKVSEYNAQAKENERVAKEAKKEAKNSTNASRSTNTSANGPENPFNKTVQATV